MLELINNYMGPVINIISTILYGKIVLNKKIQIKNINLIIIIALESVLIRILQVSNINILRSIILFLLTIIILKAIYKLNTVKSIILSFFHFLIEIVSDITSIIIFSTFLTKDEIYKYIAGSIIGNITVAIIMIIITILLKKIIRKSINVKYKNGLVIITIMSLSCILAFFYSTYNYGANKIDNLLGFIYMTIITVILFRTFIQEYQNYKLAEEYDNLLTFIKKYEIEIDNQRIIRHESKNQLLTIKAKIIDKDEHKDIIKYIDEILKDNNQTIKHAEYARLKYLPSNGLRGLFYYKVSLAQDKNINVQVNISKDIESSFLKNLNTQDFNQLCKLLGIYLDNAIESSEISYEKNMSIEILNYLNQVKFIISNSYNQKVKKIGNSTKGITRGHGLLLANKIIKNNKNIVCQTEITDKIYSQKITLNK